VQRAHEASSASARTTAEPSLLLRALVGCWLLLLALWLVPQQLLVRTTAIVAHQVQATVVSTGAVLGTALAHFLLNGSIAW